VNEEGLLEPASHQPDRVGLQTIPLVGEIRKPGQIEPDPEIDRLEPNLIPLLLDRGGERRGRLQSRDLDFDDVRPPDGPDGKRSRGLEQFAMRLVEIM
jgi:hypothetical protein